MTLTVAVWVVPERIDDMNYEQLWNDLKYHMEMAVEEGICCGYDKQENANYEIFLLYDKILKQMNRMEGVQNASN
jgi:hypothetical protein